MFDLSAISRVLSNAALDMGGSDFLWHKSVFCPYVRDSGLPCYDEDRGSSYIECPVCSGEGVIYEDPVSIKGIYVDGSNTYVPDGSGGFVKGEKTISFPPDLDIRLLKERSSLNSRRLLRDKFVLLGPCCKPDGTREIKEVLYLKNPPVKPSINSSEIYQIVQVSNNY